MSLAYRLVTDLVFRAGNPAPLLAPLVNQIADRDDVPFILLGPIPPGATVICEHGLYQSVGAAVIPTIVFPDRASPLIVTAVTDTTVTIFNPGNDAGDEQEVTFRVERKHTIEEEPNLLVQMLWQGAPGAAGPDTQVIPAGDGGGCVLAATTSVRFSTDDEEPLIYLAPLASGQDGRQVTFRLTSGTLLGILLPENLDEGIDGPPGSTYTVTPEQPTVTLEADIPNNTWWKVA